MMERVWSFILRPWRGEGGRGRWAVSLVEIIGLVLLLGLVPLLPAGLLAQVPDRVAPLLPDSGGDGSDQIIPLCPAVGASIDPEERARFGFFLYIRDFEGAVFYETPAKTYYARIRRSSGRDTTVAFTESVLRETAEAIERMASTGEAKAIPAAPVAGTGPATPDSVGRAIEAAPAPSQALETARRPWIPSKLPREKDLLPFAANRISERYPSIGLSLGAGMYFSEMKGVAEAFRTIEDGFRSEGFSAPRGGGITLPPIQLMALTVQIDRRFALSAQGAFAGNEFNLANWGNDLRMIGGLATWRFTPTPYRGFALIAGLGGGAYRFSLTNEYHSTVGTYPDGGYDILEHITVKGGAGYFTAAGGVSSEIGPRTAADLLVQYVGTGVVSAGTPEGSMSVDLSGVIVGVRISCFY